MNKTTVRKALLPWWIAGLVLGLVQVLAVAVKKPLGVSTQFVVADTLVIKQVANEYVAKHPLVGSSKYQKLGYGWWLVMGLIVGAAAAAVVTRRWRPSAMPAWWRVSHGGSIGKRMLVSLVGGFLILLGARLAHGCTSGGFASGWAQLSLSAVPITIGMFAAAMLTARFVYPKTPELER